MDFKAYYRKNRTRLREKTKLWQRANRAKCTAYSRPYRLKKLGWTVEEYDSAFLEQGGKCALCGVHESELVRALSADHCHKTLKKRRLLCGKCNLALGLSKEDPNLLRKMAEYIESFQ